MSFGFYFRELRKSKCFTQQQISEVIGKSAMLVSGVENGKNGPFSYLDLEKISRALDLSESEKTDLMRAAFISRGILPKDILDYLIQDEDAFTLLEACAHEKPDRDTISQILNIVKECK